MFTPRKIKNKGDPEGGIPGKFTQPRSTRASELRAKAAQDVKKVFSVSSQEKKQIELSEDLTSERQRRPAQTMTIEQIQPRLKNAIKHSWPNKIIGLISDNCETIKKSGDADFMELILQAAYVEDGELKKTPSNIAKEQNNSVFLAVVQNAFEKLIELKSRLYTFDLKRQKSFFTLTYLEETDEVYKEQKVRSFKSCPNLSILDGVSSVEESDKNKAGETPPEVAKESGNKVFTFNPFNFKLKRITLTKPPALPANTNKTTLAPKEQKLQVQDNLVPYGGKLEHLTKTRPKGPSRRRPSKHSDKPLIEIEDHIQEEEPTPDVIPARDAGIQEEQNRWIPVSSTGMTSTRFEKPEVPIKKEPALVVTPARDAVIHGRQNRWIPASATLMTLPSQKEKPTPDVIPARDAGIQGKENIVPIKKQSNDRNFYIALTAVCTLGAIVSFATASIYFMSANKIPALATSSIVAIGALCVVGIGFAIAAAITWCLTPSSKVESMNISDLAGAGPHCMRI